MTIIYFDPEGTASGLEHCLQQAAQHENISGLLVLCCDANNFMAEKINPILQKTVLPLAGGIFPKIIHNKTLHDKGTLVIGLEDVVTIQTVHDLSDPGADYEQILDQKIPNSNQVRTLILLVDCFATRISTFIESLFNVFGLDFNYVGGGAGSLSLQRKPYILTNSGMIMDAAILAFLKTETGIGVCHGWQELSGPYQVTGATKNIIHTIEWQPAFDFYRDVLEKKIGVQLTREKFYDIANHYPFGIARLNDEQIVRDPYVVKQDGSLICVGDIDEGTFISILQADENNLIQAAAKSLQLSLQTLLPGKKDGLRFFVDCISRFTTLNDRFYKEIDAVTTPGKTLVGICSIGEIANSGTEYLDLYNKTSVMAVLAQK